MTGEIGMRVRRLALCSLAACLVGTLSACGWTDGDPPGVCSTGDYCGQTGEAGLREAVHELPANQKVYWIGPEGVVNIGAARRFPWDVAQAVPEGTVIIVTYRESDPARDFRLPAGARFLLHVPRPNGQFVEIYGGPDMKVSVAQRVARQLRPVPHD